MKKLLYIVLALGCVISCSKNGLETENEELITFTAVIDEDTKTTVTNNGVVAWSENDTIMVTYCAGTPITKAYVVSEWNDHSFATLVPAAGVTGFTTSQKYYKYTATYGDVAAQFYNSVRPGSNCPMSAEIAKGELPGTAGIFKFQNSCGVVAVKANTGDNKISKISVGNYSLSFLTPSKLDGTYLIAIPAGESFETVTFMKDDGSKHTKNITSASVQRNELRNLNTGDYFNTCSYDGAIGLSGVFTLTSGKKLQFAKGNLFTSSEKATDFQVEKEQYMQTNDSKTHNTYFYWNKSGYPNNAQQFASASNAVYPGWRMLTKAELVELQDNMETPDKQRTYNGTFARVAFTFDTKTTIYGQLIMPDGFTWDTATMGAVPTYSMPDKYVDFYTKDNYDALVAAGVVFLPGYGSTGGSGADTKIGWYMLSSDSRLCIQFSNSVNNWVTGTDYGCNIRLVREIE